MARLSDAPFYETLREIAGQTPDLEVDAIETCFVMRQFGREIRAALDVHFGRYGLSRGRFSILILLLHRADTGLRPAELADQIGVTRASMTGLLDGLEDAGFVERGRDLNDRRAISIRITKDGKKLIKRILPDHFRRMTAMMSTLSRSERKTLASLIEKLGDGLSAVRDP